MPRISKIHKTVFVGMVTVHCTEYSVHKGWPISEEFEKICHYDPLIIASQKANARMGYQDTLQHNTQYHFYPCWMFRASITTSWQAPKLTALWFPFCRCSTQLTVLYRTEFHTVQTGVPTGFHNWNLWSSILFSLFFLIEKTLIRHWFIENINDPFLWNFFLYW